MTKLFVRLFWSSVVHPLFEVMVHCTIIHNEIQPILFRIANLRCFPQKAKQWSNPCWETIFFLQLLRSYPAHLALEPPAIHFRRIMRYRWDRILSHFRSVLLRWILNCLCDSFFGAASKCKGRHPQRRGQEAQLQLAIWVKLEVKQKAKSILNVAAFRALIACAILWA